MRHPYEPMHVIAAIAFFLGVAAFVFSVSLWIYVLSHSGG